jgi:hypothetical protein
VRFGGGLVGLAVRAGGGERKEGGVEGEEVPRSDPGQTPVIKPRSAAHLK